ncbi:hypothetical protein [Rugamonas sp.]|uniref:hypothetical protein n=1 Tax=Rugamonas sp. TaxID=1926287 RepID=UPI0025EA7EE8|nr:hypothetical protein [Rugamonas sp.]
MQKTDTIGNFIDHSKRYAHVVIFAVLLAFIVQLVGAGSHHHAYTDDGADCAACQFQHHQPNGLPPVAAAVEPAPLLVAYVRHVFSVHVFLAQPSHLIPLSQAPPRATAAF